jgi:hypothetical protein
MRCSPWAIVLGAPVPRVLAMAALAALALVGCGASQVTGPPEPGSATLPANYAVENDSLFGTPRWVRNLDAVGPPPPGSPAPYSDAAAFQIVRGFVRQYAPVFRLRLGIDDFEPTWAQGSGGVNYVKVRQTYRGIPIDVMGYGTMVLPGGAVGSMIGRFMPGISVATIPSLPAEVAARNAVAAFLPLEVRVYSNPTLMIITDDNHPRLTWWVIVANGFLTWTAIVDARDGTVIREVQNWIDG